MISPSTYVNNPIMAQLDTISSLQLPSTETETQRICTCPICCDNDYSTPKPCRPNGFSPEDHFIERSIGYDANKVKEDRKQKWIHTVLKVVTIASVIALLGILYMINESVIHLFCGRYRHSCQPQPMWNYTEPEESLLDSTVCFPCSLVRHDFMSRRQRRKTRYSELYIVRTVGNTRHCCLDQLGYMRWIVNMMKTRELIRNDAMTTNKPVLKDDCLSHVSIRKDSLESGKSRLKLDNTNIEQPMCHRARINVSQDSLITTDGGLYIIYMIITVYIAPDNTTTANNKQVIQAYLYSGQYSNGTCLGMKTLIIDKHYTTHISVGFYTITYMIEGDHVFSVLKHPSVLKISESANQIGVIKL